MRGRKRERFRSPLLSSLLLLLHISKKDGTLEEPPIHPRSMQIQKKTEKKRERKRRGREGEGESEEEAEFFFPVEIFIQFFFTLRHFFLLLQLSSFFFPVFISRAMSPRLVSLVFNVAMVPDASKEAFRFTDEVLARATLSKTAAACFERGARLYVAVAVVGPVPEAGGAPRAEVRMPTRGGCPEADREDGLKRREAFFSSFAGDVRDDRRNCENSFFFLPRQGKTKSERKRSSSQSFFCISLPFFHLSLPLLLLSTPKSMGERPVRLPPELEDVPPRPLEV